MAASSSANKVLLMEKTAAQDQNQQQQPLKCPRCDSSNTKFCYYNNYSLSQPRHFCKACKRYWTRGGTLRNVPVGGGCRKNKRIKRPSSSSSTNTNTTTEVNVTSSIITNPSSSNIQTGHIDLSSSSSSAAGHINPLFYSLFTNPSDMNLPYPRFNSSSGGFDSQMNGINNGLGFSSGLLASDVSSHEFHRSNGFLSSYPINIGSNSSSTSTMASLLASSLHQQKLISPGNNNNNYQQQFGGANYEELAAARNGNVKMEENSWNVPNHHQNHNIEVQMVNSSSDANNSLLWNAANGIGAVANWLDPNSNIGSSVTSLI